MTIGEMITWLQKLEGKYGAGPKVYFDCPTCGKSHTPTVLTAQTIHITADKESK